MTCQDVLHWMATTEFPPQDMNQLAAVSLHVSDCPACLKAVEEYDRQAQHTPEEDREIEAVARKTFEQIKASGVLDPATLILIDGSSRESVAAGIAACGRYARAMIDARRDFELDMSTFRLKDDSLAKMAQTMEDYACEKGIALTLIRQGARFDLTFPKESA